MTLEFELSGEYKSTKANAKARSHGTWRRKGNMLIVSLGDASEFEGSELDLLFEFEEETGRPTISRGATGSAVKELQSGLTKLGISPGPIDGIFGEHTEGAVRVFQRRRKITVDGIVGPITWGEFDKALAGGGTQPDSGTTPDSGTNPGGGSQPSTGSGGGARIVAEAQKHIGYHEGANNSNKFSSYFGVDNVAWCAYFVSYVHTKVGYSLNIGSSDAMLERLRSNGTFSTGVPQPGDIVIFDWTAGDHDPAEHVGIVERVGSSGGQTTVYTIEGNSSDGVNRRNYPYGSSKIVGYGRIWSGSSSSRRASR